MKKAMFILMVFILSSCKKEKEVFCFQCVTIYGDLRQKECYDSYEKADAERLKGYTPTITCHHIN